jgi:hypothetical protein
MRKVWTILDVILIIVIFISMTAFISGFILGKIWTVVNTIWTILILISLVAYIVEFVSDRKDWRYKLNILWEYDIKSFLKIVLIGALVMLLISATFTWCENSIFSLSHLKPEISAEEFDMRMSKMERSLDMTELVEISTLIINAKKEEFDDIDGWDFDDTRLPLEKNTTLGSKLVKVRTSLNYGMISGVAYEFDVILDEFFEYITSNVVANNLTINLHIDGELTELESKEELPDIIIAAHRNREKISLQYRWINENKNGDRTTIAYLYSYIPSDLDDTHRSTVSFGNIW